MPGFLGLVLGISAALGAGVLFYGAAPRQRLLARCLPGVVGAGGGAGLTMLATLCFAQDISVATAIFLTVLLLMLMCSLLPVFVALLTVQGGAR